MLYIYDLVTVIYKNETLRQVFSHVYVWLCVILNIQIIKYVHKVSTACKQRIIDFFFYF